MSYSNALSFRVVDAKPRVSGVRIGSVVAIDAAGIWVDFPGNISSPQKARMTVSVTFPAVRDALAGGDPVLLLFEDDDPRRPLIFDIVRSEAKSKPGRPRRRRAPSRLPAITPSLPPTIRIARIAAIRDGRIVLERVGGQAEVSAGSLVPLRNLIDPVLVLTLPDGEDVVIGQMMAEVRVDRPDDPEGELVLKAPRIRIEAGFELLIKSGAALIHLDARGKVATTAEQVVSRARGVNKVQGGSVQLN